MASDATDPLPHSANSSCDGYVRRSVAESLVKRFSLVPAIGDEINVWLQVVDDDVWPFEDGATTVGLLVAAVDVVGDPFDDRSIDTAMPIL